MLAENNVFKFWFYIFGWVVHSMTFQNYSHLSCCCCFFYCSDFWIILYKLSVNTWYHDFFHIHLERRFSEKWLIFNWFSVIIREKFLLIFSGTFAKFWEVNIQRFLVLYFKRIWYLMIFWNYILRQINSQQLFEWWEDAEKSSE